MSREQDFNDRYQQRDTPWELGRPDNTLIEFVSTWPILPCKALEIGCGTGHNSIWLAESGFETLGLDASPSAVEQAEQRAQKTALDVQFLCLDFLRDPIDRGPFRFAFDRGCFHTLDSDETRDTFASRLAENLEENGLWLSLIGNDDAPPRKGGPPRRSATQIIRAVEAYFEVQLLRAGTFDSTREHPPKSWQCLLRKRTKT